MHDRKNNPYTRERRSPRQLDKRHFDALHGRHTPRDLVNPDGTISQSDLGRYSVTQDGWEVLKMGLFDSKAYAANGQVNLLFFTSGTQGGQTKSDTNVTQNGIFSKDTEFLIEDIEVAFWPTVPAVTANNPAAFGASAVPALINDAYTFRHSGWLNLKIAEKDYVFEGPLAKFPSSTHFEISGALSDSSTAGASQATRAIIGEMKGKIYRIKPYALLIDGMQTFGVGLNYPEGAVALPSGNPARVVVTLGGLYFRHAQ